jgi:hypothetical protein
LAGTRLRERIVVVELKKMLQRGEGKTTANTHLSHAEIMDLFTSRGVAIRQIYKKGMITY